MTREVVVTGMGVLSPIGNGLQAFEAGLFAGEPNPTPIERFDTGAYRVRIAQTVDAELHGSADPAVGFVVTAAAEALTNAGLAGADLSQCGLGLATTATGWTTSQRLFQSFRCDEDAAFEPLLYPREELFKEAVLYAVASQFGLHGPSALLSPACAAASSAIAWAAQRIRGGEADVVLAGATDALTEVVFAGFHAMRLLADDACRPFSTGRRGLILSEGAALLVLESEGNARERGATALARLAGWGLSCDAAHPTTPGHEGVLCAMTSSLEDAGLSPTAIDQISAHGTGSNANDAAEVQAIETLLGSRLPKVPVIAIKSTTGHTEGAAGAFGALAAIVSLQRNLVPPIANYTAPDSSLPSLRLATAGPEHHEGRSVLVNASGFGGANAALVFQKPSEPPSRLPAPTHGAVITATLAMPLLDDKASSQSHETVFWPGGHSLPLDRISSLVLSGAERLLEPHPAPAIDSEAAVVLGTTYGSQARHESMWTALSEDGPRAVDPNDFALSTFNAPGSAVASAYGLGGPNLVFLGATAGATAIEEANRLIINRRAGRVLAGAYEEITPYFRRLLASLGESDIAESVCLLRLEDEASARDRGVNAVATLLGHASRAPVAAWADHAEILATMQAVVDRAGLQSSDLAAVVLDPHANTREAQLAAVDILFDQSVTLIDPSAVHGNCLSASAPLALNIAIDAAATGRWPSRLVLRGDDAFLPGRPVLINACGLMSGCAALIVQAHACN